MMKTAIVRFDMGSIQELSLDEIQCVSGGLVVDNSWGARLERCFEAVMAWLTGGSQASNQPTLTGAEIGQLQRDCLASGGNWSLTALSGSGGANVRMVGANGSVAYYNLSCTNN
jgi:hypothetical protein